MESGGLGLYDEVTQFCSISGVGSICILGGPTINRKPLTAFGVAKCKQETLEIQQGIAIAHPAHQLPL